MKCLKFNNNYTLRLVWILLFVAQNSFAFEADAEGDPDGLDNSAPIASIVNQYCLKHSAIKDGQKASQILQSIYFSDGALKPQNKYQHQIKSVAKYLLTDANHKVVVAGHADFRGSREYNLSIAQTRATSITHALVTLGANPAQIETLSCGEELSKPDRNAKALQNDRRVDIFYVPELLSHN